MSSFFLQNARRILLKKSKKVPKKLFVNIRGMRDCNDTYSYDRDFDKFDKISRLI